jgi:hypothetical protein
MGLGSRGMEAGNVPVIALKMNIPAICVIPFLR